MKTFGYGLGSRIVIGVLIAFMLSFALIVFSIPWLVAPSSSMDAMGTGFVVAAGLGLFGFAAFAGLALFAMVRTKISVGPSALDAVVPDRPAFVVFPRFRVVHVALADIGSVERRQEVHKTIGMASVSEALSVVTTSGERIGICSVTAGAVGLPLGDIADAIATAAGKPVSDDGIVYSKAGGLYGTTPSNWTEKPLDAAEAGKARRFVARSASIVTGLLLLTFVLRACFH